MAFDWKATLAAVAPTLATAIGGPLGGLAAKTVISVLGLGEGATEAEIAQAIQGATPEQLLALKRADNEFKVKMRELDIEVDRIAVDDRKSARDRAARVRDWSPQIIGALVLGVWGYVNITLLITDVPPVIAPELVGRIMGQIDAAMMAFLLWLYGSTKGSAAKDDTIKNLSR